MSKKTKSETVKNGGAEPKPFGWGTARGNRHQRRAASGVATKGEDEPLVWLTQAMFHAIVVREKMTLAIFVSASMKPGEWQVVALETATKNTATAQQVFDEHAHKIVGVYATPFLALQAAESFAAAWGKKHKAASFHEACTCEEIDSSCPHVVRALEASP